MLLAEDCEVHLAVRPGHATWRIEHVQKQIGIHELSLEDLPAVEKLISHVRPQWVFHLAAYGNSSTQTDLSSIISTNILAGVNLLRAAVAFGVEAFVNAGSSSEYGYKDHAPSEDEWIEPNSYYAVTKGSMSLFCRYMAQKSGLRIPTLRLYSAYGPFEEPNRFIPTLICKGLNGTLPPLVNPAVARDFVHVEDVCRAFILAAHHAQPDAIYNVGTGIQKTIGQVVELARSSMGIAEEPQWGAMPQRAWDTSVWVANPTRIQADLGWQPSFDFCEGFAKTVEWFKLGEYMPRYCL
jgi:dolichol-phosphate mannosyltransferase